MIERIGNYLPIVAKQNTKQQLVNNTPIVKKGDDVKITSSPNIKSDIDSIKNIVEQHPEVREDKVELAKERIRSKYYDNNIDGIVDSILFKL